MKQYIDKEPFIFENGKKYSFSVFLKEEIDHLNIVTQMWEEFK